MLDVVKKAILDLRDDIETPQFQARIDNPKDYPVLTSPEGKMMTHRMADSGNIAYPMIQLQEDGTLKDYEDNFVGAKQAALATGNYRKFDTEKEAQEYAKGGYKTEELKQFGENPPFAVQGYQQAVPEYYFEPGLQNTAPVIEATLGGLGRFVTNAIGRSKVFSDQVVDRFTRMTTPKTTYHGGEQNVGTLKTTYDRSLEGQKVDNTVTHRLFGDDRVVKELDKLGYSPFQAALYTGPKQVALGYARPSNKSLYEIDTSKVTKIFDSNKPSKFMQKELDKEIKLATKAGDGRRAADLQGLRDGEKYLSRFTEPQREFLERYGYEAVRTLEQAGKGVDKSAILIFRPEKYTSTEIQGLAKEAMPIKKFGK